MTHFLHCFKQLKKLLKTVFLEEARYFAGLFFSVRSYRQVESTSTLNLDSGAASSGPTDQQ